MTVSSYFLSDLHWPVLHTLSTSHSSLNILLGAGACVGDPEEPGLPAPPASSDSLPDVKEWTGSGPPGCLPSAKVH